MSTPISTLPPKSVAQPAYASARQLAAQPATLYGIAGYNSNVGTQFIQLHDSASAPADGAAPAFNIPVPANSAWSIDFGLRGMSFVSGVYVCNSSTPQTKTIGAADCQFFARLDLA